MTPEEKFIRGIWKALKRVKENTLYTKKGEPVAVASSLIDERALDILEEWQVIKIRENPWKLPASTKNIFYLDVNRAKVNELDSLCKNGFETNISPERLLEIIKEWVHPLGKDEKLSFEIWELIKSKKKVVRIDPQVMQGGEMPDVRPYTLVKNGKGYFKFYKEGENIEIGGKNTRHFRLLQCLCEPHFGVQKTIEAIFEAIRLPKDKNDNDLLSYSPQRKTKILTLIEYAKKELQKNKKLQRKIRYKFNDRKNKNKMWLELEE